MLARDFAACIMLALLFVGAVYLTATGQLELE
jgi:hypothetical protein